MGFSVGFVCTKCEWRVCAGGLKMYYESSVGERGYIWHPGEDSDANFQRYGIRGYAHDFLCLSCGEMWAVYFPFRDGARRDGYYGQPEEASLEEAKRAKARCECGRELVYSVNLKDRLAVGENVSCPKCGEGALSLGEEWVS